MKYREKADADYGKAFIIAAASDGQIVSPDGVIQNEWNFARLAGSSGFVYYLKENIGYYPFYPNVSTLCQKVFLPKQTSSWGR